MLGALVGAVGILPSVLAGDNVAADLLPVGIAAVATAGAIVALASEFTGVVAIIVNNRYGWSPHRDRAAALGAATGIVALAFGVWLVQGAAMLVPVPMLVLVLIAAVLAAAGAWAGVRHVDRRVALEAQRAAA